MLYGILEGRGIDTIDNFVTERPADRWLLSRLAQTPGVVRIANGGADKERICVGRASHTSTTARPTGSPWIGDVRRNRCDSGVGFTTPSGKPTSTNPQRDQAIDSTWHRCD